MCIAKATSGGEFYLVCAGRLRLMSGNPQRCVRKLGRGNAVGVGEFYGKGTTGRVSDTLIASTASTILRLPHDAVRELDGASRARAVPPPHARADALGQEQRRKGGRRHNAPNPSVCSLFFYSEICLIWEWRSKLYAGSTGFPLQSLSELRLASPRIPRTS